MGTSCRFCICKSLNKDHPHACGDKFTLDVVECGYAGSSPRVWGQGIEVSTPAHTIGIIPTRVGTSYDMSICLSSIRDHPHACGDKCVTLCLYGLISGSSPRVWGQVDTDFTVDLSERIIPTRVGTRNDTPWSFC